MGLEYVDIFYSHRPDPDTPVEETMGALDHAVRSGKALYAGISNYNAAETTAAIAILRRLGTPCLIHQFKYSMFQRAPEEGLLEVLANEGIRRDCLFAAGAGTAVGPLPGRHPRRFARRQAARLSEAGAA